jgi:hypothetical protein
MMGPEEIAVTAVVLGIILGFPIGLVVSAVRWARGHATMAGGTRGLRRGR